MGFKFGLARKEAEAQLLPVCHAYLHELVILSNGDVTTCCFDAKGHNTLGNVNEMSLRDIWERKGLPWHRENIAANEQRREWGSALCNTCLAGNYMKPFGALRTSDAEMIRVFQEPQHPLPLSLVIEPVSACNYACWGCFTGLGQIDRLDAVLSLEKFTQNILPSIPGLWQVRLYNYGESFLHPKIIDIIKLLREANPRLRIDVSTNGVPMSKEISDALVDAQVNYVSISLHGGHTQSGMMEYARRGPNVEVVKANIQYLVEAKRRKGATLPWVFMKALLFDWNDSEEEMAEFLELGKALGVDFTGWDLNNSDPRRSSKRVAPGTPAYESLRERKLLLQNFYELPAWPEVKT